MDEEQQKPQFRESEVEKISRPVLIISEKNIREHSQYLSRLLVGLVDKSVSVALLSPRGWLIEPHAPPTVEIVNYPSLSFPFLNHRIAGGMAERLADFKPTILHCLCESKGGLVKSLAELLNLPYILSVNSLLGRMTHLHLSSKHLVFVTAPSKSIASQIARRYPKQADKIQQVNIGVFLNEQQIPLENLAGPVVMIIPMNIGATYRKTEQFENLLAALRRLAIDNFDFILVIISSGRGERKLRKLIADSGLTQKVTIVPELLPLRSVLAAGDIFIKIIQTYSFDPLLLEAMGSGLIVASCEDELNELVISDETAVVFDINDELSIYESLRRLLSRPEESRKLAQRALKYLKENNSVSGMISTFLGLYRSAQSSFES